MPQAKLNHSPADAKDVLAKDQECATLSEVLLLSLLIIKHFCCDASNVLSWACSVLDGDGKLDGRSPLARVMAASLTCELDALAAAAHVMLAWVGGPGSTRTLLSSSELKAHIHKMAKGKLQEPRHGSGAGKPRHIASMHSVAKLLNEHGSQLCPLYEAHSPGV